MNKATRTLRKPKPKEPEPSSSLVGPSRLDGIIGHKELAQFSKNLASTEEVALEAGVAKDDDMMGLHDPERVKHRRSAEPPGGVSLPTGLCLGAAMDAPVDPSSMEDDDPEDLPGTISVPVPKILLEADLLPALYMFVARVTAMIQMRGGTVLYSPSRVNHQEGTIVFTTDFDEVPECPRPSTSKKPPEPKKPRYRTPVSSGSRRVRLPIAKGDPSEDVFFTIPEEFIILHQNLADQPGELLREYLECKRCYWKYRDFYVFSKATYV